MKTPNANCEVCGGRFYAQQSRVRAGMGRFCSSACYGQHLSNSNTGERHPRWKGGRTISQGYPVIRVGPKRQQREHRIVMEKKLGRQLLSTEVVHHINGNKRDNRPENLAVMSQAEHARLHRIRLAEPRECKQCRQTLKHYALGMCRRCYEQAKKEAA